jgi:hypothetical protein
LHISFASVISAVIKINKWLANTISSADIFDDWIIEPILSI